RARGHPNSQKIGRPSKNLCPVPTPLAPTPALPHRGREQNQGQRGAGWVGSRGMTLLSPLAPCADRPRPGPHDRTTIGHAPSTPFPARPTEGDARAAAPPAGPAAARLTAVAAARTDRAGGVAAGAGGGVRRMGLGAATGMAGASGALARAALDRGARAGAAAL